MKNYIPTITPNKINHIYYLSAIARKKENKDIPIINAYDETIIKPINIISLNDYINSNELKYDTEILKLEIKKSGMDIWENNKIIWRLYISIDENILDKDMSQGAFFNNRFVMELTRPQNKKTLNYLIDIDNKDTLLIEYIKKLLKFENIEILYQRPTPNGYHIVIPPIRGIKFLMHNVKSSINIMRNAILFLYYLYP